MKAELFAPVLAWLDAGAPHTTETPYTFNLANWLETKGVVNDNWCGTTCCIAGFVAMQGVPLPSPAPGIRYQHIMDRLEFSILDRAQKILGLSNIEASCLFTPMKHTYSRITPAMAARTIRHFIATGKIEWDFPEVLE